MVAACVAFAAGATRAAKNSAGEHVAHGRTSLQRPIGRQKPLSATSKVIVAASARGLRLRGSAQTRGHRV